MTPEKLDLEIARRAAKVLNEALALDRDAIRALLDHRVSCNNALGDHPTIQVGQGHGGALQVGLLGIVNGICGVDSKQRGYVAAVYESEDPGSLTHFGVVKLQGEG